MKLGDGNFIKATLTPEQDRDAIKDQLARLDFACLRGRYSGVRWDKYLNFEKFVPFNVRLCRQIGLHTLPPQRILDIGCGGGLFMFCARYYGHYPIGLDVENELLAAMADKFAVDRRIGPIYPFQPAPI